jgi:ribosomal protein S18 acetylase RimI-like enzyme
MVMTPCYPGYWEFVRTLRMDPRVAHGFIEQANISIEQQTDYMSKHWRDYYICLIDNTPAGYVGSVNGDIRVCTSPAYQGRGVGKFMIDYIMTRRPESYAKVKIDNEPSLKLFESCGFKKEFYILKK